MTTLPSAESGFHAIAVRQDPFSSNAFFCRGENSFVRVFSAEPLEEGKAYFFEAECNETPSGLEAHAEKAVPLTEKEENALKQLIEAQVAGQTTCREPPLLFEDEGLRKLIPSAKKCAQRIMRAAQELRPILLRHHDDGDGVCGGLCMRAAIKDYLKRCRLPSFNLQLKIVQTGSSIYSIADARQDAMEAGPVKPLLLLVDFGSSDESQGARREALDSGFEIICIDHHPFQKKPEEAAELVSPFVFGLNSDYCAGLLAYEVASAIAEIPVEWAWTALKSDNSSFARKEFEKHAAAIDYLILDSPTSRPLDYYEELLSDEKGMENAFAVASAKVARATEKALQHAEVIDLGPGKALLVKVGKVLSKRIRYPSKGRLMNALHTKYSEKLDCPLVSIGYEGDKILLRANRKMAAAGFDANVIIQELKREMPSVVESGGGHNVAASMKVAPEKASEVVQVFLEKARVQLAAKIN